MTVDVKLTGPEGEALRVLACGMASTGVRTENVPERGVRSVQGRAAAGLVRVGFARNVSAWDAVEITDDGRAFLGAHG